MCEVDSDCTFERASIRIDVTIKSTGEIDVLPASDGGDRVSVQTFKASLTILPSARGSSVC